MTRVVSAVTALAASQQHQPVRRVEIELGQIERLLDAQPGTAEHDDQPASPTTAPSRPSSEELRPLVHKMGRVGRGCWGIGSRLASRGAVEIAGSSNPRGGDNAYTRGDSDKIETTAAIGIMLVQLTDRYVG